MRIDDIRKQVSIAVAACEEKKAADISILELDKTSSGFTDYFVICTGHNPRQAQAISDEVDRRLSEIGQNPKHIEGYNQAEWILLDYVDFVIHVFSENARKFYDLERLWKSAERLSPDDLQPRGRRKAPAKKAVHPRSMTKLRTPPKPAKSGRRTAARPRKRT